MQDGSTRDVQLPVWLVSCCVLSSKGKDPATEDLLCRGVSCCTALRAKQLLTGTLVPPSSEVNTSRQRNMFDLRHNTVSHGHHCTAVFLYFVAHFNPSGTKSEQEHLE